MANVTLTSKAKIVILFANQYDMKDEAGDKLAGCSVHYMFWGENGEVLASEAEFEAGRCAACKVLCGFCAA
mgnify:CR=1 FL=1